LTYHLLSKNLKITIHKAIIYAMYGFETWYLTLREEQIERV